MAALRVLCWALIFILRLRFPPGSSIATIPVKDVTSCQQVVKFRTSSTHIDDLFIDQFSIKKFDLSSIVDMMSFGNQGISTLPSQNPTNLRGSPAMINGSPMPPGTVNQFAQMSAMGKI